MTRFRSLCLIPGLNRERTILALFRIRAFFWCFLSLIMTSPSAASSAGEGHGRNIPITVLVDTVREEPIAATISATGNVAAWREMPVSSETGGLAISEIHVDEGDRVEKGQVLARLSRSVALAKLSQSMAAVAEAEANLSQAIAQTSFGRVAGARDTQKRIRARRRGVKRMPSLRFHSNARFHCRSVCLPT
ncbi:biotin/lipoyl-binding protein [Bosea sp. SSUT16]|jgi:multidrug efflux pump subunit AcrA (membrane-fusion protein)|uniref:Biotin/lipoyl-binding protein n=1 Tax=Bosea spartocytisi TaxID=2773451 RepID=A0A927I2A8_9HYPH|nr:biotin/lipoyl-binding protein [Bosea spartocytisi]MBD3848591.1 biotin/lipoyl-binding protein [Bosea spartocytisi]MCT4475039.1 biotin/lipoyl-binding protein [Bosea spartocytisi]